MQGLSDQVRSLHLLKWALKARDQTIVGMWIVLKLTCWD